MHPVQRSNIGISINTISQCSKLIHDWKWAVTLQTCSSFWNKQSWIINNIYSYTSSWTFTLQGELHEKFRTIAEYKGYSWEVVITRRQVNHAADEIFHPGDGQITLRWVLQRQTVMAGGGQVVANNGAQHLQCSIFKFNWNNNFNLYCFRNLYLEYRLQTRNKPITTL
jgi:hypothetical protein